VDDQLTPSPVVARRDDGIEISLDPARLDVDAITTWLADESYWAAGRPRDVVERSIAASLSFGAYAGPAPDAPQVALARVVTDDATFAWICDVFVDEAERGRGIGDLLIGSITKDPRLAGLRRVMLATRDAHGLYERHGFVPLVSPERWMQLRERE
jgi:GNAT superfamily N-acetyltransferase